MNIYEKMKEQLIGTCDTAEEKAELLEQIIDEAMTRYNGDIELAIKNRYECDMPIEDVLSIRKEM